MNKNTKYLPVVIREHQKCFSGSDAVPLKTLVNNNVQRPLSATCSSAISIFSSTFNLNLRHCQSLLGMDEKYASHKTKVQGAHKLSKFRNRVFRSNVSSAHANILLAPCQHSACADVYRRRTVLTFHLYPRQIFIAKTMFWNCLQTHVLRILESYHGRKFCFHSLT